MMLMKWAGAVDHDHSCVSKDLCTYERYKTHTHMQLLEVRQEERPAAAGRGTACSDGQANGDSGGVGAVTWTHAAGGSAESAGRAALGAAEAAAGGPAKAAGGALGAGDAHRQRLLPQLVPVDGPARRV